MCLQTRLSVASCDKVSGMHWEQGESPFVHTMNRDVLRCRVTTFMGTPGRSTILVVPVHMAYSVVDSLHVLAQAGLIMDTGRGDYNSTPIISGGGDGGAQVYNG